MNIHQTMAECDCDDRPTCLRAGHCSAAARQQTITFRAGTKTLAPVEYRLTRTRGPWWRFWAPYDYAVESEFVVLRFGSDRTGALEALAIAKDRS